MKTLKSTCRFSCPASPLRRAALAVAIALGSAAAQANPQGAQIVNGQVSMVSAGNQLTITNTPGAIINWQSFSINAGEVTRFIQQNPQSSVLNRVVGQDPSQILGSLLSNGNVFVINPNGILFGAGAQVDVNGLVASSLKLSNEDFLAGKLNFNGTAANGDVHNQGAITTSSGGQVYLIAPNVTNSGLITSPQGDVMLAAGQSVKLADASDPSIRVVVSAAQDQALNIGSVVAQGGKVGIYGALIRQRGVVSANSAVRGENGQILFKASGDTLLEAGSVTSATGADHGGEIQVLGDRVGLLGNAVVDASGQSGGGTVLVGGDFQGANSAVQNATRTSIGSDATITADALDSGNGGRVIVWSDETTRAYGSISARGGKQGGSGGFVETSGHALDVVGIRVDTGAPNGKTGTWLLDPYDIAVRTTANGGSAALANFDQFADLPTSGGTTVSADTISASSSNVILQAKHDINFYDAVNITASGVGLVAQAGNSIRINNSIATNNGAISLLANDAGGPASGNGTLYVNSAISSNGANINLSGNRVNFQLSAVASSGADISVNSLSSISLAESSISAAAGGVVLTAGTTITQSGGLISGASLNATAALGIGSAAAPLLTRIGALTAINSDGGSSDIAISNTGALHIQRIVQSGASTGSVTIDNSGALTVDAGATVSNERGATALTSRGPLTVDGTVNAANGNITLQAASTGSSSDTLTISGGGSVSSVNGAVLLKAGSAINVAGALSGNPVTQQANLNPSTTPQPSADICTIAPDSALCQVLSPPTASEPVKPVQLASNEVIKTVTNSTSSAPSEQKANTTQDETKSDQTKVASNDKTGTKNEPVKKMYCN
jgi:filamentous hemagglutinin family protein